MTVNYTSLLGLAQPVPGTEAGTWGTTINDSLTALLDTAIAGTKTADVTSSNWTLTDIDGADDTARAAVLIPTGTNGATTRSILAPNQSKIYVIINQATGSVVIKGVTGPTTGITIPTGKTTVVAWNGTDFVEISPSTATLAALATAANGLNSATTTVVVNGATAPTTGQVLTATSGSAATWQTPSTTGGTVTSVAALTLGTTGTDVSSTVANSTTTPVITLNLPTASATNRGVLSAADWTTFNGKGSGTVTSVTGTAPVVSSGGTTPAISMAAATTSVSGYLTSTDWTTFNGKLSTTGGTMTGVITFAAGQFGTNVNTFLTTPTSANLAAALTDETGTGSAVFATSPTLVTPVLGTPSSGNLSSCTNAVAYGLKSASTTVSVSSATAPTTGQVLTATSSTAATWQSAGASTPNYGAIGSYTIAAVVSSGTVYVGGDTVAGSALCIIGNGNTSNYFGLGQNSAANTLAILATTVPTATLGLSGTWRLMEFKSGWTTTFASASIIGFWMRVA